MKHNIKLICFDLNKTLIKENIWLELNLAMGMTQQEDDELMRRYDTSDITYLRFQKILENLYIERGQATRTNILRSILTYTYLDGAQDILTYLKSKGYELALISGSLDLLVVNVANELGITHFAANNRFVFDENDYLKEIQVLDNDEDAKVHQLTEIAHMLGIGLDECACVGDGDNDVKLFDVTGHGITFTGSKIEHKAWKVINELIDLKEIF
jgi:phosphoserine phosphatase